MAAVAEEAEVDEGRSRKTGRGGRERTVVFEGKGGRRKGYKEEM